MAKNCTKIGLCEFFLGGGKYPRSVASQGLHKLKAFTLAEVLIILGIIGVIAVLTIPTLVQNANNHKFAARFKKTLSTLAQAPANAQAHYDMDYASLGQDNADGSCATDLIAKGQSTMCGLFNNTLSGHSYKGVYGSVKGTGTNNPYTIAFTTSGFNPEGNLIFELSDGTWIGFKPNAKKCHLKSGSVLSPDVMTSGGGLSNCIGFIDVNGINPPNTEVTCSNGTSEFSTSPCFMKSGGSAMDDVFLIVFHDGTAEPATNAALSVLTGGGGKSGAGDDSDSVNADKIVSLNGTDYIFKRNCNVGHGCYLREDENGNLIDSYRGSTLLKQADGTYQSMSGSDTIVYDNDLQILGRYRNGQFYDYINGQYVKEDANGNYITFTGGLYEKQADGTYQSMSGSDKVVYANDLQILGRYHNGQFYEYKTGGDFVKEDADGNYISAFGYIIYKQADGTYRNPNYYDRVYDSNMKQIGKYYNGEYYHYLYTPSPSGADFMPIKDSGNGIYTSSSGKTFTKRDDGLYIGSDGIVYDIDIDNYAFRKIGLASK